MLHPPPLGAHPDSQDHNVCAFKGSPAVGCKGGTAGPDEGAAAAASANAATARSGCLPLGAPKKRLVVTGAGEAVGAVGGGGTAVGALEGDGPSGV